MPLVHESETPQQFIQAILERMYKDRIEDIDNWSTGNIKEDFTLYAATRSEIDGYITYANRNLGMTISNRFLDEPFQTLTDRGMSVVDMFAQYGVRHAD